MKSILLYLLACTGGVFLAVQAGFNTQLGAILKQEKEVAHRVGHAL